MEFEFEITKTDYDSFYKQHYINELKKRIITAILIPLLLGYSFGGQPFDLTKFIVGTFVSGFLYLAFFYITPYFISINRLRKTISEEPEYLKKKKLSITDEGLHSETETSSSTKKWESIVSVDSNEEFVSLRLADKRFYLIPRRAFVSDNEVTDFMGIVQCEVTKRRGIDRSSISEEVPYIRGLICFIPLIGAFAGFIFILQGIFKYKDKWFTLIGVFGILFTIVLYGTLFPEIWNEKIRNEKNTEHAKVWMNNLIKDIEFYKIQNGKYPKSFDDLDSYSIYDPTQDSKGKKNCFNYKLIGDKYLLFSSGIDRIPNTKDDIYPEICIADRSKIGLLKYNCKPDTTQLRTKESTNR